MATAESTMIGRLKLIRQELGLTQREFASGAGLSFSMVMQAEIGAKTVGDKTIHKICDAYSVNERWLRSGEGRMFVDARLDAFEQFAAVFKLDAAQRQHIAEYVSFPLATATAAPVKRGIARLVKAIDRGSIGRAITAAPAAR